MAPQSAPLSPDSAPTTGHVRPYLINTTTYIPLPPSRLKSHIMQRRHQLAEMHARAHTAAMRGRGVGGRKKGTAGRREGIEGGRASCNLESTKAKAERTEDRIGEKERDSRLENLRIKKMLFSRFTGRAPGMVDRS